MCSAQGHELGVRGSVVMVKSARVLTEIEVQVCVCVMWLQQSRLAPAGLRSDHRCLANEVDRLPPPVEAAPLPLRLFWLIKNAVNPRQD